MSSHNFAHFSVLSSLCYLSNGRFLAFLYLPWCTLGQKSSFGLLVQILVWQEFKLTFGCFWMKVWILIEIVKSLIYLPLCGNEAIFPWEGPSLFCLLLRPRVLNWPSGGFLCSVPVLKLFFLFVDFNRSLLRFEGSLSFSLQKKGILIEYYRVHGSNPGRGNSKNRNSLFKKKVLHQFTSFYRQFWSLEKKKRTQTQHFATSTYVPKEAMKNVRVFQKDSLPSLMRNHYSRGIKKLFLR